MSWEWVEKSRNNPAKDALEQDRSDAGNYAHSVETILGPVKCDLSVGIVGACPTLDTLTGDVDIASALINTAVNAVVSAVAASWSAEPPTVAYWELEWVN